MKHWNELNDTIFFNKVFTFPVEIGEITLYSLTIDNDRPNIGMGFDIKELPDAPPEKWIKEGYNTCRIGLDFGGVSDVKIENIPTREPLRMKITKLEDHYAIHAKSGTSTIELKAKYVSLCGPSVYICDPDSAGY
ncbi:MULTISPECIES: Imm50 family immunity protein [Pseudomonas]|jgi:hypothetical protein|uniref:Immunity protein 50 of polymorphic toxin system n=2 Tax=Pseudomonas TaxID=286 RepID=A0A4Y9TBM3_PSEFL|nr:MULTISPECIES: Imm50 family immunity protein [Pseudomonas]CRM90023.1 hypothetical protein [Pseudomonas sp. 22 E 5]QXH69035.1 immunity 50 family protein [Pseudomonas asgharzadehiana]TFW41823.1 hypothetical protein E4T65_17925 [Pseudomonas fluorescens]TKJ63885.1 hypothetical protein PspCFBP13506_04965 [Pseudomonas sp. CFBP13506]CRM14004.1 hypothetical protein [Pseudomonas sp. 31 E 5]